MNWARNATSAVRVLNREEEGSGGGGGSTVMRCGNLIIVLDSIISIFANNCIIICADDVDDYVVRVKYLI